MTPNDFLILKNAVRSGNLKPIDVMIQKYGKTILSAPLNDEGLRLLDLAALPPGHVGVADFLIRMGAIIHMEDELTCIELAARNRNFNFLFETLKTYDEAMFDLAMQKFCANADFNVAENIRTLVKFGLSNMWVKSIQFAVRFFIELRLFEECLEIMNQIHDEDILLDLRAAAFIEACRYNNLVAAKSLGQMPMNQNFSRKYCHRNPIGYLVNVHLSPLAALKIFGQPLEESLQLLFLRDGADLEASINVHIQPDEYGMKIETPICALSKFLEMVKNDNVYRIEHIRDS